MAGKMIHEMGQKAEKNLKDSLRLGRFNNTSDQLCRDVIRRWRWKEYFDDYRFREKRKQEFLLEFHGYVVRHNCSKQNNR
jgi:hypothetical protein